MNDAEYKKEKERVVKLIEKWVYPLGLNDWDISYVFHREPDTSRGKQTLGVLMSVSSDWKYQHATINCRLSVSKSVDDYELEHALLHELMHVIVSPMSTSEKDELEEVVVTRLAKIIYNAHHFVGKSKGKKIVESIKNLYGTTISEKSENHVVTGRP